MLDYDDRDTLYFENMKALLKANTISLRVDFWDKSDLLPAQDLSIIDHNAQVADYYIPFISRYFTNNAACVNRLNNCLDQKPKKVVAITSGYVVMNRLKERSLETLPKNGKPLASYTPDERTPTPALNQVCFELASMINCIIR